MTVPTQKWAAVAGGKGRTPSGPQGSRPGEQTSTPKDQSKPPPRNRWTEKPNIVPESASQPAHSQDLRDRLLFVVSSLIGQRVIATVKGNIRYSGLLATVPTEGELGVALRYARNLATPNADPKPEFIILPKDLLEIQAENIDFNAITKAAAEAASKQDTFRTDTDISGTDSREPRRELQKWSSAAHDDGGIGGSSLEDDDMSLGTNGRPWDQFAANEKLFGSKTDYQEEFYTTKLDKSSANYRERERRAERLAAEIQSGAVLNSHVAEERNLVDNSNLNEEDKYGAVIRGEGAYVPPGARKASTPSQGALAKAVPPPVPAVNGQSSAQAATPAIQVSNVTPTAQSPVPQPTSATATSPAAVKQSIVDAIKPAIAAKESNAAAGPPVASGTSQFKGDFSQFVSKEKNRLAMKKQQGKQAMDKRDKDNRLADLLSFSQSFKLKTPVPQDLLPLLTKDEEKQKAITNKALEPVSTTANVTAVKPVEKSQQMVKTPSAEAPKVGPRLSEKLGISKLPPIPPFNPEKAKAAQAAKLAAAAQAAAGTSTTVQPAAKPAISATGSKINPNAPAFVFRPSAAAFTPGAPVGATGTSATKKPEVIPAPVNPFFGTKIPKKASGSAHIKEDFNPFKHTSPPEPSSVSPYWGFHGKSFKSLTSSAPPTQFAPSPNPSVDRPHLNNNSNHNHNHRPSAAQSPRFQQAQMPVPLSIPMGIPVQSNTDRSSSDDPSEHDRAPSSISVAGSIPSTSHMPPTLHIQPPVSPQPQHMPHGQHPGQYGVYAPPPHFQQFRYPGQPPHQPVHHVAVQPGQPVPYPPQQHFVQMPYPSSPHSAGPQQMFSPTMQPMPPQGYMPMVYAQRGGPPQPMQGMMPPHGSVPLQVPTGPGGPMYYAQGGPRAASPR